LAAPGGICVSGTVRDHIGDRLPYAFEDLGEQNVKNITRPVRVYALRPQVQSGVPAASVTSTITTPPLSIVVLPFANLNNDPDQDYFADGITEELTTDVSRVAGMLVISRNTAFTYKDKRIETKQIGRELGVRYILEGIVRRLGHKIRINAQLIEAESDTHVWAERFEGDTSDLFALQDQVTSRIAVALNLELFGTEAIRPTEHPDALDYILRGRAAMQKPPSRENRAQAVSLMDRALELDLHSILAQCALAHELASRVLDNMTDTAATDLLRAEGLAEQALATSPRSSQAHWAKGQVLRAQRRFGEAIPEYQMALASNRHHVGALFALGQCKLYTGSIEETIPLIEQSIRISPRDGRDGVRYGSIALVHLLQSRTDEAITWLEWARNAAPGHPNIRAQLASAYALNGEAERAAAELAEARRLSADDRYSSLARLQAVISYWGCLRSAPCLRPLISPACARPGCQRSE